MVSSVSTPSAVKRSVVQMSIRTMFKKPRTEVPYTEACSTPTTAQTNSSHPIPSTSCMESVSQTTATHSSMSETVKILSTPQSSVAETSTLSQLPVSQSTDYVTVLVTPTTSVLPSVVQCPLESASATTEHSTVCTTTRSTSDDDDEDSVTTADNTCPKVCRNKDQFSAWTKSRDWLYCESGAVRCPICIKAKKMGGVKTYGFQGQREEGAFITESASHLLVTPQNVIVETGGRASFNCCTNLDEGIRWMYATEENSDMQNHIYSGGFTYPQWRTRYNVTELPAQFFTLTIEPVVPTNSGFYSCMDIKDDSYHEAKLEVTHILESPTPDSLNELHTSEHSMIYERSSGYAIGGIVFLCLLISSVMVALWQWKFFKSGKLFGAENLSEKRDVGCSLPIHFKHLMVIYFNNLRNSNSDIEAAVWQEKCRTQHEEEEIYMVAQ